ncbi:MAG TPA: RNA polymerase sigma factor [Steroidobacteraceae bacterium]|jgi:RNA polymerase sigma-70 factor (ECF subfamily)|nr:RNA polymerase sigma factor [Steroidobacteraceae bacterium]
MTPSAHQLDAIATSDSRSAAIEQLFREHNHLLICFLEARLGHHQEAKDVAQEAYVRLLELERPNTISFLRAYLFKIAANLAIDRIRSRGTQRRADVLNFFIDDEHADCVEQEVVAAEQAGRFWESLGELPRHYRQAVVMNRIEDLSTLEIAASMGKTDRTVRRYIADALTYCRLRLLGQTPGQASARTFRDE